MLPPWHDVRLRGVLDTARFLRETQGAAKAAASALLSEAYHTALAAIAYAGQPAVLDVGSAVLTAIARTLSAWRTADCSLATDATRGGGDQLSVEQVSFKEAFDHFDPVTPLSALE